MTKAEQLAAIGKTGRVTFPERGSLYFGDIDIREIVLRHLELLLPDDTTVL
jgi:hypothetical protein